MHRNKQKTGCSAVRLAHLLWEQGVPGSNPGIPTEEKVCGIKEVTGLVTFFVLYGLQKIYLVLILFVEIRLYLDKSSLK